MLTMTASRARLGLWVGATLLVCLSAYQALHSLIPFAIGALISYALAPLVDRLMIVIPLKQPNHESWRRGLAVLIIYLVFLGALTAVGLSLIPVAAEQIGRFIDELPASTERAREQTMGLLREYQSRTSPEVQAWLAARAEQGASTFAALVGYAVQRTISTLTSTLSFIFGFAIVPFWMFYAMRDRHFVGRNLVRAAPLEVREDVRMMITLADRMLGRYLRAQIFLGLVIGLAVGVLMTLMGVDLSLGLGVWAGVTELIPIIGPWLGAIPGLIMVAATNPSLLPWVALAYLLVQVLENNLLVPRIQGHALDLHPAIVVLLLVIGGAVWGFLGLVVVIPATAILRELFWYVDRRLRGLTPEEAFAESRLSDRKRAPNAVEDAVEGVPGVTP